MKRSDAEDDRRNENDGKGRKRGADNPSCHRPRSSTRLDFNRQSRRNLLTMKRLLKPVTEFAFIHGRQNSLQHRLKRSKVEASLGRGGFWIWLLQWSDPTR